MLRPAVPADATATEAALFAVPDLALFWEALAAHVLALEREGWSRLSAAAMLLGAVLTPLRMGYDAHGTLPRAVRRCTSMARRAKAAAMARKLADMLDEISREPLPPCAVVAVAALLHPRLIARDAPRYFQAEPTAEMLRRLAAALEEPPRFADVPGLASQKPSWRGFIRAVRATLADLGFKLRERDAVVLTQAVCRAAGFAAPPSRDAVRDALRWEDCDDKTAPE
ncbi:hypothetical protein [Caldovatus sediminis]|uniref:hypothetical protein n=1 Tax=Caldovatus sediminis TaxID=2041189 RepID=UPI001667E480|nr:hypothetical protein [Caldovatus sediminis]